jgi:hypothetical protein
VKSASAITRGLSTGNSDMRMGSECQKRAPDLAAVSKKGGAVTAVPPR